MQYTKGNTWRALVEVLRSDGGMIARRKSPARLIGNLALREQTVHSNTVNLDGKIIIIESHVISKQIVNNLDVVDDVLPCRESPSNSANCTNLMELSTPSASCCCLNCSIKFLVAFNPPSSVVHSITS